MNYLVTKLFYSFIFPIKWGEKMASNVRLARTKGFKNDQKMTEIKTLRHWFPLYPKI